MPFTLSSIAFVLVSALSVLAESHTVRFQNNCGTGTPKLIQAGKTLSTGEDYTSNGQLNSAIAYLNRNDECLLNGENCSIVEMNLNNPTCAGCGSSVDISLIPSHAFNVDTAFAFFGGDGDVCDGLGAVCSDPTCNTAFFVPDDNQVQRACQADNVNLLITFCGGSSTSKFTEAVVGSMSGGSSSGSSSKAAVPSSSSAAATPSSSKASSPTTSTKPSASVSIAAPSNSAVANAGDSVSSAPPSSPSSSPAPTCKRRRTRSTTRSTTFSRHARSQARARAFAGMHDSKL